MKQPSKKKILIADDEPNIRLLVSHMLSKNYIVLEAQDGESAIDIAKRQKPDLILMDIMMPKLDGYYACHAIKADKVTRAIPVVMLTALDHEFNHRLAQEIGAEGYMVKPLRSNELLRQLKRTLSES